MTYRTIHAKLIDYNLDINGYITYVFWNIDYTDWTNKYVMCTRYPNWNQAPISLNENGYLQYAEVLAGEDTWYDNENNVFIKYNYTHVQFIKFIPEQKSDQLKEIIL